MDNTSTRADRRCPYAVPLWLDNGGDRVLVRCSRRRTWWPHHHRASLIGTTLSQLPHVDVRWRSSTGPDYHVAYEASTVVINDFDRERTDG